MAGAVCRIDVLGDAEIDHGEAAVGAEHQVLGLEVAVQDALLVDVAQREHEVAKQAHGFLRRQRLAAEPLVEVAALEKLHHQVGMALGGAVGVDARDVAALDALDQGVLLHEPRQGIAVRHHLGAKNLDHQRLVVAFPGGEIHARHAALADQVQHLDAGNLHPRAERLAFHARGELGRKRPLARAGSEVADGGDQFLSRQFLLALVVVRAGLHGAHRDDLVACSREKQDRRAVGAALEFLQPLQAVAAPQHVVQDHDVVAA